MSDPNSLPVPRRLLAMARENPEQVRWLGAVVGIFLLIYFMPAGTARFDNAVLEGIRLTHWYAQEHVILCLLPAFVIAGAMATYLSQGAVMRYLGPSAPKPVAFGMASVSGTLPVAARQLRQDLCSVSLDAPLESFVLANTVCHCHGCDL
ncbi:permease [Halomonas sp. Y3]|uniref:permease n=1 Tax=Halomonas sp. Y3 TaxID=2956797 RepID=UPI0020A15BBE|nr:permease [Halomonas sp. Y3]